MIIAHDMRLPATLPLEPLLALVPEATNDWARAQILGISVSRLRTWRRRGLRYDEADRLAVSRGIHPAFVWADWFGPVHPGREVRRGA